MTDPTYTSTSRAATGRRPTGGGGGGAPGKNRLCLFDVGGVILSNAWDSAERAHAASRFALDAGFESRHAPLAHALERGEITLDHYLAQTVFDRPRDFSPADFRAFIESCSEANPDSLALLARLAANPKLRLATLNNEGLDLNAYRIAKFGLCRYFSVFCTSCYLGARKPEPQIYQRALGVLQADPAHCLFVDDREENLVPARALGMRTIHFQSAAQLETELNTLGLL
jgi:putative hydrolase of the HAD superfamily